MSGNERELDIAVLLVGRDTEPGTGLNAIAQAINDARHGGKTTWLTSAGKPVAAIVPERDARLAKLAQASAPVLESMWRSAVNVLAPIWRELEKIGHA